MYPTAIRSPNLKTGRASFGGVRACLLPSRRQRRRSLRLAEPSSFPRLASVRPPPSRPRWRRRRRDEAGRASPDQARDGGGEESPATLLRINKCGDAQVKLGDGHWPVAVAGLLLGEDGGDTRLLRIAGLRSGYALDWIGAAKRQERIANPSRPKFEASSSRPCAKSALHWRPQRHIVSAAANSSRRRALMASRKPGAKGRPLGSSVLASRSHVMKRRVRSSERRSPLPVTATNADG